MVFSLSSVDVGSSPSVKNPWSVLATRKTVLFFPLFFVSVTHTSTTPIAMWIMTACFVCSDLLTRWLHWLHVRFDCTGLPCIVVTVMVHHCFF